MMAMTRRTRPLRYSSLSLMLCVALLLCLQSSQGLDFYRDLQGVPSDPAAAQHNTRLLEHLFRRTKPEEEWLQHQRRLDDLEEPQRRSAAGGSSDWLPSGRQGGSTSLQFGDQDRFYFACGLLFEEMENVEFRFDSGTTLIFTESSSSDHSGDHACWTVRSSRNVTFLGSSTTRKSDQQRKQHRETTSTLALSRPDAQQQSRNGPPDGFSGNHNIIFSWFMSIEDSHDVIISSLRLLSFPARSEAIDDVEDVSNHTVVPSTVNSSGRPTGIFRLLDVRRMTADSLRLVQILPSRSDQSADEAAFHSIQMGSGCSKIHMNNVDSWTAAIRNQELTPIARAGACSVSIDTRHSRIDAVSQISVEHLRGNAPICVTSITRSIKSATFRNVKLFRPLSGIKLTFAPENSPSDSSQHHGHLANILIENVILKQPRGWPIVIAPDSLRTEDPNEVFGAVLRCYDAVADRGSPSIAGATLRHVRIDNPRRRSPGLIIGSSSSSRDAACGWIEHIVFDKVQMVVSPPLAERARNALAQLMDFAGWSNQLQAALHQERLMLGVNELGLSDDFESFAVADMPTGTIETSSNSTQGDDFIGDEDEDPPLIKWSKVFLDIGIVVASCILLGSMGCLWWKRYASESDSCSGEESDNVFKSLSETLLEAGTKRVRFDLPDDSSDITVPLWFMDGRVTTACRPSRSQWITLVVVLALLVAIVVGIVLCCLAVMIAFPALGVPLTAYEDTGHWFTSKKGNSTKARSFGYVACSGVVGGLAKYDSWPVPECFMVEESQQWRQSALARFLDAYDPPLFVQMFLLLGALLCSPCGIALVAFLIKRRTHGQKRADRPDSQEETRNDEDSGIQGPLVSSEHADELQRSNGERADQVVAA